MTRFYKKLIAVKGASRPHFVVARSALKLETMKRRLILYGSNLAEYNNQ
jgi:hypothetical protein